MSIDDIVGLACIAAIFAVCIGLWRKLRALEKEIEALEEKLKRPMDN